jgi:hypothetical protein
MHHIDSSGIKQLTINGLIEELKKMKKKVGGNEPVYYRICGHSDSREFPMEVEAVEILKTKYDEKVEIW